MNGFMMVEHSEAVVWDGRSDKTWLVGTHMFSLSPVDMDQFVTPSRTY